MNIFKELNKLPQADINDVSYGNKHHATDSFRNGGLRSTNETAFVYEGKSYRKWSIELGVTKQCIHGRIKNYGDPYPRVFRQKWPTNFEGKTNSQWADILEVSVNTIHKRMKRFGNPFHRGDRNFIGNGSRSLIPVYEGKTHQEWAEVLGVTKSAISKRLREWEHPYNKTTCRQMGLL